MPRASFKAFQIVGGALDGEIVPLNQTHEKHLGAGGVCFVPYNRKTLDIITYQVVPKNKATELTIPKGCDRVSQLILCSGGYLHEEKVIEVEP